LTGFAGAGIPADGSFFRGCLMKRLGALLLAMMLPGCAELQELIVGDYYDEWYVVPPPVTYPAPTVVPPTPIPQPSLVTPTSFSGTTGEPEMIRK
jgi:hypothetical protein